jgi:hypothetical protein
MTHDTLDGRRLVSYQCVVLREDWLRLREVFWDAFRIQKAAYRRANGGKTAPTLQAPWTIEQGAAWNSLGIGRILKFQGLKRGKYPRRCNFNDNGKMLRNHGILGMPYSQTNPGCYFHFGSSVTHAGLGDTCLFVLILTGDLTAELAHLDRWQI